MKKTTLYTLGSIGSITGAILSLIALWLVLKDQQQTAALYPPPDYYDEEMP